MIKSSLFAAIVLATVSASAAADVLTMPADAVAQPAPTQIPDRGMTMDSVRATFGDPSSRRGPIGQPPITRWDYEGFVVVFEHNRVINAVVPSRPPTIYNEDQLRTAP